MKILICSLNFSPELTGVGKYSGEMAQWLAQRGHEVVVVTGYPYYPDWQLKSDDKSWRYRQDFDASIPGLTLIRCPIWVPQNPSFIKRIFHLFSFALSSFPALFLQALALKPDVVWVVEPTLFSAPGAYLVAKIMGAKSWLHIQDFEFAAAAAFNSKILERVAKLMDRGEVWLAKKFDRISTLTEAMRHRLLTRGVSQKNTRLFPNWFDDKILYPLKRPSLFIERLQLKAQKKIVLYSGNLGRKQGIELLLECARQLENKNIHFVCCGDGAERAQLVKKSAGLTNWTWLPLQPLAELNELLNVADIHVLPQLRSVSDLLFPSKLLGMMATGKPVVATADPESELGKVLENCARVVMPENLSDLALALEELAGNKELRDDLGERGLKVARKLWQKEKVLTQFEDDLKELAGASTAPSFKKRAA